MKVSRRSKHKTASFQSAEWNQLFIQQTSSTEKLQGRFQQEVQEFPAQKNINQPNTCQMGKHKPFQTNQYAKCKLPVTILSTQDVRDIWMGCRPKLQYLHKEATLSRIETCFYAVEPRSLLLHHPTASCLIGNKSIFRKRNISVRRNKI